MIRWLLPAVLGLVVGDVSVARAPNIILILVDDLGYGELGCQGNAQIPTPHIDSIAANGVRFTNGYVSSPYCCPSRAGLMTGRYQTRFGHELNAVGRTNLNPSVGLPPSEITLATMLQEAGYATGLIGKWHLGATDAYHPTRRGFDEFYGFEHEGHFYVPPPYEGVVSHLREKEPPYDENNPILRGTDPVEEREYFTDALTREATAFIDRHRDEPFFLYLSYNAIHSPMQASQADYDRFAEIEDEHRRVFAAMLWALDRGVGQVLEKVQEHELTDNTLIIFLSDNGGPTAELTSSNAPLRGGKGQLWEGGIRVPFLMQWPGTLPAGTVVDAPVISLDIVPTAVAAASATLPEDRVMDGANLLPYLTGKSAEPPHEVLFWRYGPHIALRKGDWKLVRQGQRFNMPGEFQLFNLAEDIGEETDLSGSHPDIVESLMTKLNQLNAQMVEPRWGR